MSYCMFQASNAVNLTVHSTPFGDSVILKEYSRLVPTFYALETWVCSGRSYKRPCVADKAFKITGICFTWTVGWITPGGPKIHACGFIKADITLGKVVATLEKTSTPWSLLMIDPYERSTSCSFQDLIFNITISLVYRISTADVRLNQYSNFWRSILAFRSYMLIPCTWAEKLLPLMKPASFILSFWTPLLASARTKFDKRITLVYVLSLSL